ncbi:MAG: HigA family addiction module antitoxin [Pseudomonadota bacterium]
MSKRRIPLHPGEFIKRVYIEENGLKASEIAAALEVHKGTFSRLLNGQTALTSDMAVKLSAVLGRSPESWMNLQSAHSLAKAEQKRSNWKPTLTLKKGVLVKPSESARGRRTSGARVI